MNISKTVRKMRFYEHTLLTSYKVFLFFYFYNLKFNFIHAYVVFTHKMVSRETLRDVSIFFNTTSHKVLNQTHIEKNGLNSY